MYAKFYGINRKIRYLWCRCARSFAFGGGSFLFQFFDFAFELYLAFHVFDPACSIITLVFLVLNFVLDLFLVFQVADLACSIITLVFLVLNFVLDLFLVF